MKKVIGWFLECLPEGLALILLDYIFNYLTIRYSPNVDSAVTVNSCEKVNLTIFRHTRLILKFCVAFH